LSHARLGSGNADKSAGNGRHCTYFVPIGKGAFNALIYINLLTQVLDMFRMINSMGTTCSVPFQQVQEAQAIYLVQSSRTAFSAT
jgi:hypothetical protein